MARIFFILLLALPLAGSAQHLDKIQFESRNYDFGTIDETGGAVTHAFRFANIGGDSLRITSVNASCGCTTPSWTREVVAPGDSGYVEARYDPNNRPGAFNKTLTVNFDGIKEPVTLLIRGRVNPKPGPVEEEFRRKIGGIRLRYGTFNMGKVFTTEAPTISKFEIYNDSDTVISFSDQVEKPAHVDISFQPVSINPGETGYMVVSYDARARNDLGFNSDNITFYTDEPGTASQKSVNLYATIEEYFPPMTEEDIKKAPHLSVKDALHDFEDIKEGVRVSTSFTISNSGQSILNIRQVKGNCTCISASAEKMTLKPGESTTVNVTFDSSGRKGNQQKSVTVYSNDPTAPAQRMTVRARVDTD